MRRQAEREDNKIKKQNAKLRTNAIFGQLIENPMNKVDVITETTRKQYLKWWFRLTLKREKHFRNGAIAIKKDKCRINPNKPIYIGTSILNSNNVLMKEIRYNYIENNHGSKTDVVNKYWQSYV